MNKVSILSIGLLPTLIDYADPAYAMFPGMTAEKVQAGLDRDKALI